MDMIGNQLTVEDYTCMNSNLLQILLNGSPQQAVLLQATRVGLPENPIRYLHATLAPRLQNVDLQLIK